VSIRDWRLLINHFNCLGIIASNETMYDLEP
jgi:hypothetical protein